MYQVEIGESNMPALVSHSEVDTFNSCERKHLYSFGYRLEKKGTSDALYRGTTGHSVLRRYYNALSNGALLQDAIDAGMDVLAEEMSKGDPAYGPLTYLYRLMPMYFDYYKDDYERFEVVAIEEEYRLQVTDELIYPFKPDFIVKDRRTGDLEVWDHKFVYNFFTVDEINLLGQLPKYIGALRALGIYITRGRYNEVRYRPLKEPTFTDLFRREQVKPSTARIQRTFLEQLRQAEKIADVKAQGLDQWSELAPRVLSKSMCGFCSFKMICTAEMNGSDTTLMQQVEYRPNTYGYHTAEEV
jgi:hypothetical protein